MVSAAFLINAAAVINGCSHSTHVTHCFLPLLACLVQLPVDHCTQTLATVATPPTPWPVHWPLRSCTSGSPQTCPTHFFLATVEGRILASAATAAPSQEEVWVAVNTPRPPAVGAHQWTGDPTRVQGDHLQLVSNGKAHPLWASNYLLQAPARHLNQ